MENAFILKYWVNAVFLLCVITLASLDVLNSLKYGFDYFEAMISFGCVILANLSRLLIIVIADIAISINKNP